MGIGGRSGAGTRSVPHRKSFAFGIRQAQADGAIAEANDEDRSAGVCGTGSAPGGRPVGVPHRVIRAARQNACPVERDHSAGSRRAEALWVRTSFRSRPRGASWWRSRPWMVERASTAWRTLVRHRPGCLAGCGRKPSIPRTDPPAVSPGWRRRGAFCVVAERERATRVLEAHQAQMLLVAGTRMRTPRRCGVGRAINPKS